MNISFKSHVSNEVEPETRTNLVSLV